VADASSRGRYLARAGLRRAGLVPGAYAPIRDFSGATVGMLYVGVLERPFTNSLWRSLLVFLGIAAGGVALVYLVSVRVARRISGPIHGMALAAQRIAQATTRRRWTGEATTNWATSRTASTR